MRCNCGLLVGARAGRGEMVEMPIGTEYEFLLSSRQSCVRFKFWNDFDVGRLLKSQAARGLAM